MNLLLLGSNYFQAALAGMGHNVFWAGTHQDCDLRLSEAEMDMAAIRPRLAFSPDALILTDDLGRRVLPEGLETLKCPKVYYAVDSPINFYWQKHFAHLFDLVLVDQRRCAEDLRNLVDAPVHWLPVAVDTSLYTGPPEAKVHDLAFVGVVNEKVRPKRYRIIESLSRHYRLHTAGGRGGEWVSPSEAGRLYRSSRLVLNENLFPGVTTRMFEAMASGAALFTEDWADGLETLFTDGEDLLTYGPDSLLDKAGFFLADEVERERIAASGREKVLAGHDIRHRAETLIHLLESAKPRTNPATSGTISLELGKALFLTGIRWPAHDGLQRLQRAEQHLLDARRLRADDPEAGLYLALIKFIKGDAEQAGREMLAAAEAGSVRAMVNMFILSLENGGNAASGRFLQRAAGLAGLKEDLRLGRVASPASLHLAAGLILEASGQAITPGFSRQKLPPLFWQAFEHYQRASTLDPGSVQALEKLGDILAAHQAHNEAHHFLSRAAALNPESGPLQRKAESSGRNGYMFLEKAGAAA